MRTFSSQSQIPSCSNDTFFGQGAGSSRPAAATTSGTLFKVPAYRLHRSSGNAVVTLAGRDVYLGKHGTKASHLAYKQAVAEFLASGGSPPIGPEAAHLTIAGLILRYWNHLKTYQSRTLKSTVKPALRRLRNLYGQTPAAEFGPLKLEALRDQILREKVRGEGLSRPYVNRIVKEIRRMFKWGVSKELVPASILQALCAVEGLRYGRCKAPEPTPVLPVSDSHVNAVMPFLSPVVADMVRVQRLTGMRPAEVCWMTVGQIDMTGDVWIYTPRHHKTLHAGKSRTIPIGPKAQTVLRQYLSAIPDRPLFRPSESVAGHKERWRKESKTPMTPSRQARDARRAQKPRRTFNERFDSNNYATAIRRACKAAGIEPWAPNRLRHARATEIRASMGLEAAGAVLGHAKLETTQIYAERQAGLAAAVARQTG